MTVLLQSVFDFYNTEKRQLHSKQREKLRLTTSYIHLKNLHNDTADNLNLRDVDSLCACSIHLNVFHVCVCVCVHVCAHLATQSKALFQQSLDVLRT